MFLFLTTQAIETWGTMEETDLSTCRGKCKKIKIRKHVGSFDGTNKKFVDENGELWNGRICPGCHKDNVKSRLREKRADAKSVIKSEN